MKVEIVDDVDVYADAGDSALADLTWSSVRLQPAPLDSVDTSQYVRSTLTEEDVGAVEQVEVALAWDGDRVLAGLDWTDVSRDDSIRDADDFVDKAAVGFPVEPGASALSMGSENAAFNAWYWRADEDGAFDVVARGFGTSERRPSDFTDVSCSSVYTGEGWRVVFTRPFSVDADDAVDFGRTRAATFAVWEGSNEERGPMKSYSGEFRKLEFEEGL